MQDNPTEPPERQDLSGTFAASFRFHGWHTVRFSFTLGPGTEPHATSVEVIARPGEWVSAEDLRALSLPRLLERAVSDMTGQIAAHADPAVPRRHDVTRGLLEQVAAIFDEAGGNRSQTRDLIEQRLSRSRSQAYRLIARAEQAGYITTTTEGETDK